MATITSLQSLYPQHRHTILVVTIYFQRHSLMRVNDRGNGKEEERRNGLDDEYAKLRERIGGSRLVLRVAPYHKMHISAWLRKMDQPTDSDLARKIRNNYAKLLNLMCECQVIVAPFDQPPEGHLPRLSKQRINQIIDEVEEAVRLGQEIEGVNESSQAFNHAGVPFSSIIASQAQEVIEEEGEYSQVIGRFANQSLRKAPDYSGTYFSVMQESRESETSQQKITFFSDMKPASVDFFPTALDCQQKEGKRKARHIKVEINTFHPQPPASPAFQRLEQSRNSQPSPSLSDTSQQLCKSQISFHRNHNLSKGMISQESLSQTNCQQIEEVFNEDPDFSNQLSERCREKDQPRNSQIAWGFKKENSSCEAKFHKQKLTMTESIPSKGLFRTSTFNSKNSSISKDTIHQRLKTNPDESFNSKPSLASELRDYEADALRDLTNISFLTAI